MRKAKRTDGPGPKPKILRPWKILESRKVFTAKPWVQLSVDKVRLPDGRVVNDFYQMRFNDAVVIFAVTSEGKVLMERQYKHGVRKVTLTLPTGGVSKGEKPLSAAQRELKEETGYVSKDWQYLGRFAQFGNMGGGHVNVFQAREAEKRMEPNPGDLEEMEIVLMDPRDLIATIRRGEISILNTVAAILLATHPWYTNGGLTKTSLTSR